MYDPLDMNATKWVILNLSWSCQNLWCPHSSPISEVNSWPIFTYNPQNQSLGPTLLYVHMLFMFRCLQGALNGQNVYKTDTLTKFVTFSWLWTILGILCYLDESTRDLEVILEIFNMHMIMHIGADVWHSPLTHMMRLRYNEVNFGVTYHQYPSKCS